MTIPVRWTTALYGICLLAMLAPYSVDRATAAPDDSQATRQQLERQWTEVVPLLQKYCFDCHANDTVEADVDLAVFDSIDAIRKQPQQWLRIREMLNSRQMPPKDALQPSEREFRLLQDWVRSFLLNESRVHAGDPGPIPLRRLSNSEYTFSLRDLTGVESLDPAAEFPVDGAAGEGFTNVGSGQGMSPALVQKYLEAAKQVSRHAVLTPTGIRFSPGTTRRDHTDELLAKIQSFYRRYTVPGGGTTVNFDGRPLQTNQGGRLPLAEYLKVLRALPQDDVSPQELSRIARQQGLSVKYLTLLRQTLNAPHSSASPLLQELQDRWRSGVPIEEIVHWVEQWQHQLWQFHQIGQIGREGTPESWMTPVSPVVHEQLLEFTVPANLSDKTELKLTSVSIGSAEVSDRVVWEQPRFVYPAEQFDAATTPLLLRDLPALADRTRQLFAAQWPRTAEYLAAVREAFLNQMPLEELAEKHHLNPHLLANWQKALGLQGQDMVPVGGHLSRSLKNLHGYSSLSGWGGDGAVSIISNRANEVVSFLTITAPPRSLLMHPNPEIDVILVWRSPIDGDILVSGGIADADDKCGNGAAWNIRHATVVGTQTVASGEFENGQQREIKIQEPLHVRRGETISVVIRARDHNHVCDTTHVSLTMSEVDGQSRVWSTDSDLIDRITEHNPLPDRFGHDDVWYFCSSHSATDQHVSLPDDSTLSRWRQALFASRPTAQLVQLEQACQHSLQAEEGPALSNADRQLRSRLSNWNGPLAWRRVAELGGDVTPKESPQTAVRFGPQDGTEGIHPGSLIVTADSTVSFPLPKEMVAGAQFVSTGRIVSNAASGGAQLHVNIGESPAVRRLTPGPIVGPSNSDSRTELNRQIDEFRQLFPPALCYERIVPVDEVVTLTLFHREDEHLQRLMLRNDEISQLDQLWDELLFVSREPLELVVALEQIIQFATQDRQDLVPQFQNLQEPTRLRAEAFRKRQTALEPVHVESVLQLAQRAWRRPLGSDEQDALRSLYQQLRETELSHEEAVRLLMARVLSAPAFLYKLERPAPGETPTPVSDFELATRLSYFVWSSLPDEELLSIAQNGTLSDEAELSRQVRRMLAHPHVRRMAIEFFCQWMHFRDFDRNDDKNEKLYPQFAELRTEMYEETVQFFTDLIRRDQSILSLLQSDHTFLNHTLAKHYQIPVSQDGWQRVDGVGQHRRGGVLTMATFLASQSGASRTSPILRGNWIYETLLGQRLPRPPANVPQLPDDVPDGLTARELIEQHSSNPACAKCHVQIDPYGFALEQFDAIGRQRSSVVDTSTVLVDGTELSGVEELQAYLLTHQREAFVRQFCRKLLGFALGREILLSDELLLQQMQQALEDQEYRFSAAVETIIRSPQFRHIRPSDIPESLTSP